MWWVSYVKNSLYFETNQRVSALEKVNANEIPSDCDKKATDQMFLKI